MCNETLTSPFKAWRHIDTERLLWVAVSCEDWHSGGAKAAAADAQVDVGEIFWIEDFQSVGDMKLKIPYFTSEQLGDASEYGPLSIESIVRFSRELAETMTRMSSTGVLCLCCSGSDAAIGNSLLLVGAFLILERRFSATDALQKLFGLGTKGGLLSEPHFPMPWSKSKSDTPFFTADSLKVQDCFYGLEKAIKQQWFDYSRFNVEAWRASSMSYDAVPIFSISLADLTAEGKARFNPINVSFWVAADPVTTVVDASLRPRPPTSQASYGSESSLATARSTAKSHKQITIISMDDGEQSKPSQIFAVASSLTTVATTREWWMRARKSGRQLRKQKSRDDLPAKNVKIVSVERPHDLSDFAHWLKHKINCVMLVGANFQDERGLPGGSYDTFFEERGIGRCFIPFQDGTSPPMHIASVMIETITDTLNALSQRASQTKCKDYSVVVHCKAGLGRSMCLLAALAVSFIPGLDAASFFGWARLARPGCIQTAGQERFLRSLDEEEPPCCRCCFFPSKPEPKRDSLHEKVLTTLTA